MRILTLLLVAAFLLAGCSGPEAKPNDGDDVAEAQAGQMQDADAQVVAHDAPFDFTGTLATYVHGCVFPAGQCPTSPTLGAAENRNVYLEHPGTNLTGLEFNVTWQSNTATQKLSVTYRIVSSCEGCNNTPLGQTIGVSPLHVSLKDLNIPLGPEDRINIYVSNPTLFTMLPTGVGYAVLSAEQAFKIDGVATVESLEK